MTIFTRRKCSSTREANGPEDGWKATWSSTFTTGGKGHYNEGAVAAVVVRASRPGNPVPGRSRLRGKVPARAGKAHGAQGRLGAAGFAPRHRKVGNGRTGDAGFRRNRSRRQSFPSHPPAPSRRAVRYLCQGRTAS